MLVEMLANPNATRPAIAPAPTASSSPDASNFADALAASGNALPAYAPENPSSAPDPANSSSAPEISSSVVSGVAADSNPANPATPTTLRNTNGVPTSPAGTVFASSAISKSVVKTSSRSAANPAKSDAPAWTANQSSIKTNMTGWSAPPTVAAQVALNLASLGKNSISPAASGTASAAVAAVASSSSATGATIDFDAISSATTSTSVNTGATTSPSPLQTASTVSLRQDAATIAAVASYNFSAGVMTELNSALSAATSAPLSTGTTATALTPQIASTPVPRKDASPPPAIPLPQIAVQPQNASSTGITSPIQVASPRTASAILSDLLPVSASQVSASPASPNSALASTFVTTTETKSTVAPNPLAAKSAQASGQSLSVDVNSGAPNLAASETSGANSPNPPPSTPVVANLNAAPGAGESASVTSPGAANIIELPDKKLLELAPPDIALQDNPARSQTGLASQAFTQPISTSASPVASIPEAIPTGSSAAASVVAATIKGTAESKSAPSASDAEQIAPFAKPGPSNSGADATERTVLRDADKLSSNSANRPMSAELVSTGPLSTNAASTDTGSIDSAAPESPNASVDSYLSQLLNAASGSSGSGQLTSTSDTPGSAAASAAIYSASGSSADPSASATDPSAAILAAASLSSGSKSSAAAASVASLQSSTSLQTFSLQSSLASSASSAPTHDAASNAPPVVPSPLVPSPSSSVTPPAIPEKSGAPAELPLAHQMLDSAPVAPTNDPALVGAHLPSDSAALQMHLGVHTNAFGNIEIHTVVEQSQVGVAIHGDRDLARWFNSEVGGLETGLKGQHLNLTSVDFSSNRSGVQTASSFQQGQPRQNSPQNAGTYAAAPSHDNDATAAEAVNELDLTAALPLQGMETRVSILA
jgi:hypothetical protein